MKEHPDTFRFTGKRNNPTLAMARLDYILLASSLIGFVDEIEIISGFRSDHSMLNMELTFEHSTRSPGFWKLNTTLLENQAIIDELKIVMEESLKNSITLLDDQRWENLKFEIGQFCREQSQFRAKERKEAIKKLEKQITKLEEDCSLEINNIEEQEEVNAQIEKGE